MIYVDEIKEYLDCKLPYKKWCHMVTDSVDLQELHEFATSIGIQRKWFQSHGTHPHYDLIPSKRSLAIKKGATAVNWRELVTIIEERNRKGTTMSKQIVRIAPTRGEKQEYVKREVCHDLRYILILDTETTTDFVPGLNLQHLRIAGYLVYDTEKRSIREKGFLYDAISNEEKSLLEEYCMLHSLKLWERYMFVNKRLYPLLMNGASYANHNIKFDIGALATSWFYPDKDTIAMVLCNCLEVRGYDTENRECVTHPSLAVQHLPSGKYLFSVRTTEKIGAILDTMQLGKALLGAGVAGSLLEMGKKFRCETVKFIADEHGTTLNEKYLDYTMNDVKATLELFLKELEEYTRHAIPKPLASLVSEASVGKGYLAKANITPFYERHKNVPEWYERIATSAYKGGRSEVMHRLEPVEIAYLDFMSQYPLVNALLNLQSLLLANYVSVVHVTSKIRSFLSTFKIEDLQHREVWHKLRVFVKIQPDGDILPCESREAGDMDTVLRNTATYGPDGWYTLCDVIASIIRTGKSPYIIDAVEMIPSGKIATTPIQFYGRDEFTIDLNKEGIDLFASLIDLRSLVKKEWAKHERGTEDYGYYESLQNGMKLVANSTSYGALAETRELKGVDVAGKYACYAIAAHITSGGRLLLAIAEALGSARGLRYVMCDTDSMAFARPSDMARETFLEHIEKICTWFTPLSPFKSSQEIFELEAVNGDRPLYFVGISSKRYAVFHILEDDSIVIRKATVNGVGGVMFDRELPFPDDVPNPKVDARYQTAKGVKPLYDYQYLLWYRAIQQIRRGETNVTIPIEEWSSQLVRFSVGLNTPYTLKIHQYISGVRPFSFLTKLPSKPFSYYLSGASTSQEIQESDVYKRGTSTKVSDVKYVYLYEQFKGYFTHPEAKVKDGSATGFLEKVIARPSSISYTSRKGKEATTQLSLFDIL